MRGNEHGFSESQDRISENRVPTTALETAHDVVERVMRIEAKILGTRQQKFLVKYLGEMRIDSEQAYDQLAAALRPHEITPLTRTENDKHTILLIEGVIEPKPSNPFINLIMFSLTVLSMLFVGLLYSGYSEPLTTAPLPLIGDIFLNLWRGWPFAVSLLVILLAHEFGHYLAARYHKSAVTLPYFIPFPIGFGTLGAFIQLKEPPKNKKILLDIGIAGPLAGLVIAIPVLLVGLFTSELITLPSELSQGMSLEGNSIFYLGFKYLIFGEWLPKPESYQGLNPVLYWIRYMVTGSPLPLGGLDVSLNSVAWAGWAGLLVTALNLIPAGQLDGGHLLYVLFGSKARKLLPIILVALVALAFITPSWWLWVALLFFLGRHHAEPLDQITPVDSRRKALAALGLILFVFLFMPVPIMTAF